MGLADWKNKASKAIFNTKVATLGYSNGDKIEAICNPDEDVFTQYLNAISSTNDAIRSVELFDRVAESFLERSEMSKQGISQAAEMYRQGIKESALLAFEGASEVVGKHEEEMLENLRQEIGITAKKLLEKTDETESQEIQHNEALCKLVNTRITQIKEKFGLDSVPENEKNSEISVSPC